MSHKIVRQKNIENVLNQAMKLFVANGVENTSMEMIARASDLTLRSVQNYFHSKNDLYIAVLNRGYAIELEEMKAFFSSEQYRSKSGAEQVMEIVITTLYKAIEYPETVFCTTQLQHIISRVAEKEGKTQLTGNWTYLMDKLQDAFDSGHPDGSIMQATEKELVDVKTTVLALLGIREQIAYAMCNKTLRDIFDPQAVVQKYIRQMKLVLTTKIDHKILS